MIFHKSCAPLIVIYAQGVKSPFLITHYRKFHHMQKRLKAIRYDNNWFEMNIHRSVHVECLSEPLFRNNSNCYAQSAGNQTFRF